MTASPSTASNGAATGLRRHLITCLDLASRFGFALGVTHLSSHQTRAALELYRLLLPVPMRRALSDNGSEFAKHFNRTLQSQGVTHWHTYPRTPRMNAHCERFNRTVQEEFVDYREDLLFDDLAASTIDCSIGSCGTTPNDHITASA